MKNCRPDELNRYCYEVLIATGVDEDCAQSVADLLVDADLTGVSTHGVSRLAIYVQRLNVGVVSCKNNIKIVKEGPSSVVIDAGNTLGAPSAGFAIETCIRKAKETGCCFAAVHGSNHFGAAAFYTKKAVVHDMIGFACTNVTGKIAPYGSKKAFVGTNPFSIAAPSCGRPVVLDMTPTTVALGKLISAQRMGQQIPLGWALDEDGHPTTDPAEGRKGSLVPIGGPKGSGLAIMGEILCGILSGAGYSRHLHDLYSMDAPQGVGHLLGAIDIAHFIEPDLFKTMLSQMIDEIKGLEKANGYDEILLPGERGLKQAEENLIQGIDLPDNVYAELLNLGKPYGITI